MLGPQSQSPLYRCFDLAFFLRHTALSSCNVTLCCRMGVFLVQTEQALTLIRKRKSSEESEA